MISFHQSMIGKKFLEGDFPELVRSIKKSNELKEFELQGTTRLIFAQEKANELKELELELKRKELELKEIELTLKQKEMGID